MSKTNMRALLALVENKASRVNEMIESYTRFFKGEQGQFRGTKRTYSPKDGYADKPEEKKDVPVVATVDEKFDWFIDLAKSYVSEALSIEATNSIGAMKVDLVVDGISFGLMSANELMRLRNFINQLDKVFKVVPTRDTKEIWSETTNPEYAERNIWETRVINSVEKTTIKTSRILEDPNVEKLRDTSKYQPVVSEISRIEEIGDITFQSFSGEWSHLQKANLLKRKSAFIDAITLALSQINGADSTDTELDSEKFLKYLVYGKY